VYLKSLTLKGFKSFADRTHMVFDPGLTVIVGPNGSGKSNISDSILWVLGEQSAKHLRGQAMEDVVFAGSSARKPVGVAEVVLVLDNSDHTLPVDFDEVAITRRMYRSGESEYLINASPARLMDIQDILHDSGLGKETRSIISQGKLDEILMSRPEERRALIEEAAGISKHKRRRERASRKIDAMEERLKSILRLQRELNRQIRPLEKQVEVARKHQELTERADRLSIELAVDDLRRLQSRWGEAERASKEAEAALDAAQRDVSLREEELAGIQERLERMNARQGDLSEQRRRCQSVVERLEAAQRLLGEKGRTARQRADAALESARRSRERLAQNADELREVSEQLVDARGEEASLKKSAQQASEAIDAARDARRSVETELSKLSQASRSSQQARDRASVELSKARDALESARSQAQMLEAREKELAQAIEEARTEESDARRRAQDNDSAIAAARAARDELKAGLDQARAEVERTQRAEAAARAELSGARAELSGLERATLGEENRTPLASRVAGDREASARVVARVSETLDVPEELTGLVEDLLAERMRGFVVPSAGDALLEVARVASGFADSAGQVAIVAAAPAGQGAVGATDEDGLPGFPLASRIGDAGGLSGVAAALLGDVRVVDTLDQAVTASKGDPAHVYVTPAGQRARGGNQVVVGHPADATHGLLASRARLRELSASIGPLDSAHERARADRERAEATLSEVREASDRASQELARLTGAASSLSSEAARAKRALDAATQERARVLDRRKGVERQSEASRGDIERLQSEMDEHDRAIKGLEGQVASLNERLDSARRDERAARERGSECQVRNARLQERLRYLDSRYNQLGREAVSLSDEGGVAGASLVELRVALSRVSPLAARLDALLACAREAQEELSGRASASDADLAGLRAGVEASRAALSQAQTRQARALESVSDVKVTKGRLDEQVSNAVRSISSRKGVVLEEALKIDPPADREADEAELARLEAQIAALGPVNQIAFEQYAQLKERVDYVNAQVADLQQARSSLTKVIAAIDRKMRNGFVTTFDRVNENFRQIFSTLFPGGNGYLEMTDPDDPSQTGIEVIAQPRGKRVTKMSLLSGGERSLTALGLLFAVYRTRTVPFYVLDEVEAALDDSNLDRLLDAIDVLRQTTQLIVISHQRRTMEKADVLYGVSMQADGVSHVVSQRLDRSVGGTAAK
jgi:chromosome segregation protein